MAAAIVIEMAAKPPGDSDTALALERALVDACSKAAGPGGCVLGEDEGGDAPTARARVVVSFAPDETSARVRVLLPSGTAREAAFRDEDPQLERYRAAGLIAAGLVAGMDAGGGPPAPALPPALTERHDVATRLGARAVESGGRPWAGVELGADVMLDRWGFVALSGTHDATWARDTSGIAEQRTTIALGAGLAIALVPERLELRGRVQVALEDVRASIVQPGTGRQDAGDRALGGVQAGVELAAPLGAVVGAFAGVRLERWADETDVLVSGQPTGVIDAWACSAALGLNVRLR